MPTFLILYCINDAIAILLYLYDLILEDPMGAIHDTSPMKVPNM